MHATFDIDVKYTGAARPSIVRNSFIEGMDKAYALYPLLFRV
jgi:hypothetical protein